jgi:hypothetical protein
LASGSVYDRRPQDSRLPLRAKQAGSDANPFPESTDNGCTAFPNGVSQFPHLHQVSTHTEAIQFYEETIVLNQKIGVKRRLNALEKKVAGRL